MLVKVPGQEQDFLQELVCGHFRDAVYLLLLHLNNGFGLGIEGFTKYWK